MKMEFNSMDELVGFYIKMGYTGFKLKEMLEKDNQYAELLRKRKEELTKIGISKTEQKKYVLLTDKDIRILKMCNALEKVVGKKDGEIIKFIKTQLEEDWRRSLLSELKRLERKYAR